MHPRMRVHSRVPREPVNKLVKLLSVIFEKLWQSGKFPSDRKMGNNTPFLKTVKRRTQGTTDQSASSPCLVRSWSRSSW